MPDGVRTQNYIQATNLELGYEVDRGRRYFKACENLTFGVERGKFVALVGRSGAGKTTLLMALQGLVDVRAGELSVNGEQVTGPSRDHAVVFQQASLFPWLTVRQNVMFGLKAERKLPEVIERVDQLIAMVGLQQFEKSRPGELSGGMQQRVNLARALAVDPGLLLLDEPFGALDAQTREAMQSEMVRIWEEAKGEGARSRTAVFVTHDLQEAVYLADQVIVMSPGPARIRAIVDIDLDRPRDHAIKRDGKFLQYVDQITEMVTAVD